jgi:hypothetical protein
MQEVANVSQCNLCDKAVETSQHFLGLCFNKNKIFGHGTLPLMLLLLILFQISVHGWSWSPQCKIVIIAAIIDLINAIWLICRNKKRFDNKIISCKSTSLLVISNTQPLSRDIVLSYAEFMIIILFNFYHQLNLVWGLTSSGFILLPIAVAGDRTVILPTKFSANYHWTN